MNAVDLASAVSEIKEVCADETHSPRFFFLVGAGISAPSIKLASEITEECKSLAESRGRGTQPNGAAPIDLYSHWFERAFPQPAQRQEYLRDLIKDHSISHANLRLAHLLLDRKISNLVVTPNFDDHLSRALILFGKPHILCDHPRIVDRIDPQNPEVQIVHVHGTYWFYDCCNLRGEIEGRALFSSETSQTIASMLDNILSNHSALVIGYSGWQGDVIMAALRRRLLPNRSLPYKLYWFCYRASDASLLPEWLKSHPSVCFVVPKPDMEEEERPARAEQIGPREEKLTEGEEARLPATQVLDALVQALALKSPELTRDPLGFFARQLRSSLPRDTLEEAEADPYFFSGLSDQVEQLRVMAERVKQSAQKELEEVLDAIRRSDYAQATERGLRIDLQGLSKQQIIEFIEAIWLSASELRNQQGRLRGYDLVIAAGDVVLRDDTSDVAMKERVALALLRKGNCLGNLRRNEEAVSADEEVVRRYGDAGELTLRESVARALVNKAVRLGVLRRNEDALIACDEALKRFGAAAEPQLKSQVARALSVKAKRLRALERNEEALATLEEMVRRFEFDPSLVGVTAAALFNQATLLADIGPGSKTIEALDRIIARFGTETDTVVEAIVADAMIFKAHKLEDEGRADEAIQVFNDIEGRFAGSNDLELREKVAKAMVAKGEVLRSLGRTSAAIEAFDQVLERIAADDAGNEDEIGRALLGKAEALAENGFGEEAAAVCRQILNRFTSSAGTTLRRVVREANNLVTTLKLTSTVAERELPEFRDFIRSRRAALFGFMEQGAALKLNGDLLTVIPRNDIYVRYLNDNRNVIADLASELYGRRIEVEVAKKSGY